MPKRVLLASAALRPWSLLAMPTAAAVAAVVSLMLNSNKAETFFLTTDSGTSAPPPITAWTSRLLSSWTWMSANAAAKWSRAITQTGDKC